MITTLQSALPIPSLTDFKSILCIGPHPDDIEIGLGAMLAWAKERNMTLSFIIVTDGGAGSKDYQVNIESLIETRKQEARKAAALLGVQTLVFLDFPDGGMYRMEECAHRLVVEMLRLSFDVVFCPDPSLPNEVHPDHLKVGQATKEAVFLLANPVARKRRGLIDNPSERNVHLGYYYTHRANSWIEIQQTHLQLQQKAIICHQSQYPENEMATHQLFQYLMLQKQQYGLPLNRPFADGFALISPLQQHCYPEWNHYESQ